MVNENIGRTDTFLGGLGRFGSRKYTLDDGDGEIVGSLSSSLFFRENYM